MPGSARGSHLAPPRVEEPGRRAAGGAEVRAMAAGRCAPSRLPLLPGFLVGLLAGLLAAGAAGARWGGEGSSPHLRSIFLGRCADYSALLSPAQR